jgi:hypothetical protein
MAGLERTTFLFLCRNWDVIRFIIYIKAKKDNSIFQKIKEHAVKIVWVVKYEIISKQ